MSILETDSDIIQSNSGNIDFEKELNSQQLEVVKNIDGQQLVIAGAGSGKTRTLVYRVAYLIEKGIAPQSILLLTFTRKAAYEMTRRASSLLDERCSKINSGTFHSFANIILRKYAYEIEYTPNFTIIDSSDASDIIGVIRNSLGFNKKERRFPNKDTIYNIISKSINTNRTIESVVNEDYPHFNEEIKQLNSIAVIYSENKKKKNLMDYDDLLVNLRNILEIEHLRIKISERYRYIMVDEYQDTNRIQAQIACLLASEHGNIMVVGDDSQSIYSFRGANFKNIMDFPKIFPETVIKKLEQNYRSTQPILNFTNHIIENAKEKYSKKLFSLIEGEDRPSLVIVKDGTEQAKFICQRILELMDNGVGLNEIAVLFRASFHSNELELELKKYNIPFVKYGGIKFVEAAHIKDTISYLRIVYNPMDDVAWHRILLLIEQIGDKTAEKILMDIIENKKGIDGLSDINENNKHFPELHKLSKLLNKISKDEITISEKIKLIIEYYTPLLKKRYDNFNKRIQDIIILSQLSEKYKSIENFITDMALEPPAQSQVNVEESDKETEFLTLSTIHSAKGLEWQNVFILNMTDGAFPSVRSIKEDNLEEERRLFYVAATRAKRGLFLLTPNYYNIAAEGYYISESNNYSEKSRFLTEIKNLNELTERKVYKFRESDDYESDQKSSSSKSFYNNIKNFFDQ